MISSVFVRLDDVVIKTFGVDIEIDGRPARGIFDDNWSPPDIGTVQTEIVEPTLTIRNSDAETVKRGSTVTGRSRKYAVVRIERVEHETTTRLILRPKD